MKGTDLNKSIENLENLLLEQNWDFRGIWHQLQDSLVQQGQHALHGVIHDLTLLWTFVPAQNSNSHHLKIDQHTPGLLPTLNIREFQQEWINVALSTYMIPISLRTTVTIYKTQSSNIYRHQKHTGLPTAGWYLGSAWPSLENYRWSSLYFRGSY